MEKVEDGTPQKLTLKHLLYPYSGCYCIKHYQADVDCKCFRVNLHLIIDWVETTSPVKEDTHLKSSQCILSKQQH